MKQVRDEVDRAPMTLQVVQSEQKVDLIVFEDSEATRQGQASDLHISQVHTAEDPRRTDTLCHTSEPRVK